MATSILATVANMSVANLPYMYRVAILRVGTGKKATYIYIGRLFNYNIYVHAYIYERLYVIEYVSLNIYRCMYLDQKIILYEMNFIRPGLGGVLMNILKR